MLRRTLSVLLFLLVGCGSGGVPAAVVPGPLLDEITYVGMGASDAVGVGAVPFTEGYVYRLAERLRERAETLTLRNVGISGARIEDIVARELPDAVAADPDVVTLWTGANDVVAGADPDAFAAALDFILDGLRTGTAALVFVADLPDLTQAPLFRVLPDPDVTTERVNAFNVRIAQTVARHGFVLVRLSEHTLTDDMFFADLFHPNNAGHAKLAEVYWTEMAPRL